MQVRVYYEDTDFSGAVYHASYLRFMERGRTNYLRLLGADQRALFEETEREAPGFAFVVRTMQIEFLKAARMDDVLAVVTETEEVRGASITLHQQVLRGDEVVIDAHVKVAFVAGGRARPIPKALRLAMRADQESAAAGLTRPRPGFASNRRRCRRGVGSHVSTIHMSWSKDGGRSGPRGYHHGNLKEALLRAALELIAKKGPAGFTFAEAARWAGVSPAAPYRHFRDRDELLANIALRGFQQFEAALAQGLGRRPPRSDDGVRSSRQSLSRLRAHRARLLLGDVRGRDSGSTPIRSCARAATAPSRCCAMRPSSWSRPCRRRAVRRR